jgi:hypothetical protein
LQQRDLQQRDLPTLLSHHYRLFLWIISDFAIRQATRVKEIKDRLLYDLSEPQHNRRILLKRAAAILDRYELFNWPAQLSG